MWSVDDFVNIMAILQIGETVFTFFGHFNLADCQEA